jgi:hypothetical protein
MPPSDVSFVSISTAIITSVTELPTGHNCATGCGQRNRNLPLAALLFTSAAWRMAPRDSWIGWSDPARQSNLPLIVNHSRFLILPWAQIPNLASHILACAARQLPGDWLAHYGVEPVLLETLADPARYRGVCYRAANWIEVGLTQGRGRMDRSGRAQGIPKQIFLYPLHRHCRQRLCTPSLRS